MKKRIALIIIIAVIVGILFAIFSLKPKTTLFGIVGYSPVNFPNSSQQEILDYFAEINQTTQIYGVNSNLESANQLVTLAVKNVNKPMVLVLDYKSVQEPANIIDLLRKNSQIKYLGLGNEVNLIYSRDKNEFETFISNYFNAYGLIKAEFPGLKIFTVFQYEALIGQGTMTGIDRTNEVNLIRRFESQIDLIGLTVYPHFDYDNAASIPNNYFDYLIDFKLPIGITETSWPSNINVFSGDLSILNTSEQEQADYISWLSRLDKSKFEFVNWLFLNDIDNNNTAFLGSGLKDDKGVAKSGYTEWRKLVK